MNVDPSGNASWHAGNVRPEFLLEEPGEPLTVNVRLVLGSPRGLLHAAHQFLPTSVSQVGGVPGWIQDAEYPRCPDCHETMPCISQVSPADLAGEPSEGLYYAFWCSPCRVTATGYQQT